MYRSRVPLWLNRDPKAGKVCLKAHRNSAYLGMDAFLSEQEFIHTINGVSSSGTLH